MTAPLTPSDLREDCVTNKIENRKNVYLLISDLEVIFENRIYWCCVLKRDKGYLLKKSRENVMQCLQGRAGNNQKTIIFRLKRITNRIYDRLQHWKHSKSFVHPM